MSLYDREYYRQDPRLPPAAAPGLGLSVTTWLVIANVAAFFLSYVLSSLRDPLIPEWWARNFLFHPYDALGRGRVWQFVTAAFLHADLWHLFFNMLSLWMFGRGLEALYGRREFLAFYLEAGIVASLAFGLVGVARGDPSPGLGASGCVFGVIALYAIHWPRAQILVWGVFPLRAWQMAALLMAATLAGMIRASGNVGDAAHLGGALFGGAFWLFDLRLARLRSLRAARPRPRPAAPPPGPPSVFLPEEPAPRGEEAPPGGDADVRRRVDELLDKISRHGLASLTDEERAFLKDASRKYRS